MKNGLFSPIMKFLILFIGLSTSAFLFVLYWALLRAGFPEDIVRTFIFASFGTYTLFLAFSVRSLERSIFLIHFFQSIFGDGSRRGCSSYGRGDLSAILASNTEYRSSAICLVTRCCRSRHIQYRSCRVWQVALPAQSLFLTQSN